MRCLIALLLSALVLALMYEVKAWTGGWSETLFCVGLGTAVFLPIYDLITNGEMKRSILLTPFAILAAAVVARFLGV